jgi:hypothetical protein
MFEKRKSAASAPNEPAIIVANNVDFPIRYAAWFGARRAKAAAAAAKKAQFHAIPVDGPKVEELASRLTEGVVEGGAVELAQVDNDLARQIDALIVARQVAEAEAKGIEAAAKAEQGGSATSDDAISDIWDLKPGALVIAADLDRRGAPEAWYEAEIISLEGPEFLLRFRDFPRDGVIRRTRRHIAILHPVY